MSPWNPEARSEMKIHPQSYDKSFQWDRTTDNF